MDARDEPGRIEIELTSNAPDGTPTSARFDPGTPLVARSLDAPLQPDDDRRLLAVATLVGIVGLMVGLAIGRAGGGGDDGASSETTPPSTALAEPADQPIAAPSAPSVPSTAPPGSSPLSRSTMTSVVDPTVVSARGGEPQVVASITVDERAAEFPVEVIGRGVDGGIVWLDLATGRKTTQPLEAAGGPPVVLAGDGWAAIPSWDGRDGWTIVDDSGAVSVVDMSGAVAAWRHASSELFWARAPGDFDGRAIEIDVAGEPTGRVIELNGTPQFADPNGDGIVVTAPGGTYVAGETSSERITPGHLVALGRTRAVAYECDDTLQCGHVVIERETGTRRPIEFGLAPGTSIEALTSWTTAHPLDPAEEVMLAIAFDQRDGVPPRGGTLDLSTGEFTEITAQGDAAMMRWAPDGRSVMWLDRGRLKIFDSATGESVDVAADLGLMTAFTIRDALPSVEGG